MTSYFSVVIELFICLFHCDLTSFYVILRSPTRAILGVNLYTIIKKVGFFTLKIGVKKLPHNHEFFLPTIPDFADIYISDTCQMSVPDSPNYEFDWK